MLIIAVGVGLTIGANKLAAKRAATKAGISLGGCRLPIDEKE